MRSVSVVIPCFNLGEYLPEAVDSILVVAITFFGVLPPWSIVRVVISMYLLKVAYEVAATPITYAVVNWLKRKENVDVYDRDTNFNPFAV